MEKKIEIAIPGCSRKIEVVFAPAGLEDPADGDRLRVRVVTMVPAFREEDGTIRIVPEVRFDLRAKLSGEPLRTVWGDPHGHGYRMRVYHYHSECTNWAEALEEAQSDFWATTKEIVGLLAQRARRLTFA